jgi:hypothetical protein
MKGPVSIDTIRKAHAQLRSMACAEVYLTERLRVVVAPRPDRLAPTASEVGTYTPTIQFDDFAADVQDEARASLTRRYASLLRLLSSGVRTRSALIRRARMEPCATTYGLQLLERAGLIECSGRALDEASGQMTNTYRLLPREARHD